MPKGLLAAIQTILFVMIGIFLVKLATKAMATKFPNRVTKAIDNVSEAV